MSRHVLGLTTTILLSLPMWVAADQPPGDCGWRFELPAPPDARPTLTVERGAPLVLPGTYEAEWNCDRDVRLIDWSLRDANGALVEGAQVPASAPLDVALWRPLEPLAPGNYALRIEHMSVVGQGDDYELQEQEIDVVVTGPQGWELTLGPERSYRRQRRSEHVCCPGTGHMECGVESCVFHGLDLETTWSLRADADAERLAGRSLRYTLESMHPEQGMDFVTARASTWFPPTQSSPARYGYEQLAIPIEVCLRLVLSVDETLEVLGVTPWRCELIPELEQPRSCVVEDPLMCPGNLEPIPVEDVEPRRPPIPDSDSPPDGPRTTEVRSSGCGGCVSAPSQPRPLGAVFVWLVTGLVLGRRRQNGRKSATPPPLPPRT